jgi:probable HAF family extracellular repeat protein
VTLLSAINNPGDVLGISNAPHSGGFLYSTGTFSIVSYPGATATNPLGINDSKQIVGYYYGSSGYDHGFLESAGNYSTIDFPVGAQDTVLVGINNHGQIRGYYTDAAFLNHAFIYQNGTFTQLPLPNLDFAYFTGFNDSGQFVGYYVGLTQTGFLATPN